MHSTEVQAKPLFSWKALGWALLYFWFFSTLLQAIIYISGYSGTNGIRDSLLFSSLWLIPAFLFPKRIKIIAAVIGVVLWAASLAALCYYVIYGQEFSQSVLFVMFETNTNEASEYLSQRVFKPVFQPENCAYRAGLYGGGSSAVDTPAPGLYSKAVALCCLFCPTLWLDSASDRHEYVYQKQAI